MVITIISRVWSWSLEPKDIGFKKQKTLRFFMSRIGVFHAKIIDGKKGNVFKNCSFVLRRKVLSTFLLKYNVYLAQI